MNYDDMDMVTFHKSIPVGDIKKIFRNINFLSFIGGALAAACIFNVGTKSLNTRSQTNPDVSYTLSGISSTYDELEKRTFNYYENYVDGKSEWKEQKLEYKDYLENLEIIKKEENGKKYVSIDDEKWKQVSFCIYDARNNMYNEEGLAKLLACKLALCSIGESNGNLYFNLAYYIDNYGNKQYFESSSELLSLFPTGINELEDIKYDLGDCFIKHYVDSKKGLFSDISMCHEQSDIEKLSNHTIGKTLASEKNTSPYGYKYNPNNQQNLNYRNATSKNMTRVYRR